MNFFRYIAGVGLTMCFMGSAIAQDFPKHPGNQKDAESQGLVRIGIKELKTYIPGTIKVQGHKGNVKIKTFRPDGTLVINNTPDKGATWTFDEEHNGYCNTIPHRNKVKTNCFYTFKAADGVHYFDYDVENGFYAGVWRPESK